MSSVSTSSSLTMSTRIAMWLLLAAGMIVYFAGQRKNPPGFFADEASIAWNALQIARHGVDEHGVSFPLYFRAFGEYKNPVYIYALAGVFEILEPTNLVARRLSALFGYLACVTIGAIAWRISRSRFVTAVSFLTVLFTPMIFEISRIAFEVALYPLATALFLLAVYNASRRDRWTASDVVLISSTLVLMTYTYSIGRLLAPASAALLFIFYSRERRWALATIAIVAMLVCVIPIAIFNATHDHVLTLRFRDTTYLGSWRERPLETVAAIEQHFAENLLPLGLALRGDPNARHHLQGTGGSILLMTFVLAVAGAVLISRTRDRWWWFVAAGTLLSIVPVALTMDRYHTLRMAAYPVFLIALSIPALQWLRQRRGLAFAVLAIGAVQAAAFMFAFETRGALRRGEFDAGARRAVDAAIDAGQRPIYVDPDVYIHSFWYGAQRGVPRSAFVVGFPSRPNALVISAHRPPDGANIIRDAEGYAVYVTR